MKSQGRIDPLLSPVAEFPARLGWTLRRETIYSDPPSLCIGLIPEFPGCNPDIAAAGILWDVLALFESACRAGAYYVLNCECGYPPDAYLEEPVFVSHPDAATIVWEIDSQALAPVLTVDLAGRAGHVRLVFSRQDYEADVRAMLQAIRAAGSPELQVEELEPDVSGMALEKALALDVEGAWVLKPTLVSGTIVEFGFSGSHLLAIDGEPDRGWPVRLFPRWSVYACFQEWLRFVCRGFALRYTLEGVEADWSSFNTEAVRNDFFLLRESERAACDRAGEALARSLKAAFDEGCAAPGVEVVYRSSACRAVLG